MSGGLLLAAGWAGLGVAAAVFAWRWRRELRDWREAWAQTDRLAREAHMTAMRARLALRAARELRADLVQMPSGQALARYGRRLERLAVAGADDEQGGEDVVPGR